MIRNYLLVTFRNLWKNKIFTLINILGLGVALAVCIVAFFNNKFNYEFDRTHENFDEIYRITSFRDMQGREQEYGIVPATLGLEVKKDIPGIERSARLLRSGSPVKEGDDIFPGQISYVDPEFLDIFTFPPVTGDMKSISQQGNVLLSQKMAETLFGDEDPLGKTLSIVNDGNKEFSYRVGAVFTDLPENSSFRIDILTHFDNFLLMWQIKDTDWKSWANCLFIQVPDKKLIPSITQSLKNYLPVQNNAREDFKLNRFSLVPMADVGSNTRVIWSSSLFPSLHPAALISPPIMALFILLIACFNFANTAIAIFSKRLKEIGLRKTFGGRRSQLVTQFMFETLIVCLLALFVGIALASVLVPAYSNLWEYMSIYLTFSKYGIFWLFLILLLLLTGFISGVYPALHMSKFSPAVVLKGSNLFRGSGKLSSVLLTLQFTISVMALVMGIVFAKNARYQISLDRGFDRENLIIVPVPMQMFTTLRNEVISNPNVIAAEGTLQHVGWGGYRKTVKDAEKKFEVDVMDISPEYAQTVGLRLKEGRFFDKNRAGADRSARSVIVNQKLIQAFGWPDGAGRTMTLDDTVTLTVIGVVGDFYNAGLWEEIEPVIMRLSGGEWFPRLAIRANPEALPGVLDFVSQKWKTLGTNQIFGGMLQEDATQEERDINGSILKVNMFLAIIATLLSLIGMYNLVSLDIIKRTKEVGIRKIQGAPVPVIMYLVSRKFLIVLLIASVLGCTGGFFMSNMLLDSIWDYFVKITPGILIMASLIIIIATVLTISIKVIKAAMRNPVDSLRYE